jgi:hypothetical protein
MSPGAKLKIAVGCVLVAVAGLLVVLNLESVEVNLVFARVRISLAMLLPAVFALGGAAGFIAGTFWRK